MRAILLRFVLSLSVMGVAVTALSAPALAQDNASLEAAKQHFDQAKALFQTGKYKEAAELFDKAYQARPFPQFLFNIGACHEKLQGWQVAVDYYNRYLAELPNAPDAGELKKRIAVLKEEAKKAAANPPPKLDPKCDDPAVAAADPQCKPVDPNAAAVESEAVKKLAKVGVRGVVVIESQPSGASIYIDRRDTKPMATTPWSGNLPEGNHKIFVERKEYAPGEYNATVKSDAVIVVVFPLSKQDFLGYLEITANVDGAKIYINDRKGAKRGEDSFDGSVPPGKYKIWVVKEGYEEFYKEVEVKRNATTKVSAELKGSEVGYLNIRGDGVEYTAIYMDKQLLCERGPCRKGVAEGTHTVEFKRKGYKPYSRRVVIQQKTETTVYADLVAQPGRGDAIAAYVFTGLFLGGGIAATVIRSGIKSDLQAEIGDGELTGPPTTSNDKRLQPFGLKSGKTMAGIEVAAYSLSGISLAVALWRTFRDKGPPSTGRSDVKSLDGVTFTPTISPDQVGFGLGFDF